MEEQMLALGILNNLDTSHIDLFKIKLQTH